MHSCRTPTKGNKIRSGHLTPAFSGAHKRVEMLRHPCILRDPQQREQNQKWLPHPCLLGAQKRAEVLHHPCVLGDPLQKGTETKVAHKRAEELCHPCFLRVPQTRGQSQRWPTSGQKCYVTHTFSGVPEKGFNSGRPRAPGKNPIVGSLRVVLNKKKLVLKDHPGP